MGQIWQILIDKFSDLIQFCYHLTDTAGLPNYGLAIIMMTVIIKVILYPLTNSQLKSMRGLQEIQPKMKAIQARYKDNPEKMQMETMKLYKEHGVNPAAGCLPLLIQMPILLAFYQALYRLKYIVPEHAMFLWVNNLSQPDPYYLLPILAAVTTYLQQKITTADPKDPTQRSMLIVMPLLIGWMATKFAAGLALYWVMFTILSIFQQLYVNRRYKPKESLQPAIEAQGELSTDDGGVEVEIDKGGKSNADHRKKRKKRR